jgi:hypothetical protein
MLLRANVEQASLNSNVALLAMGTVAGSGLIVPYLYGRIHLGLYGHRAQIAELQTEIAAFTGAIEGELSTAARVRAALERQAECADSQCSGAIFSLFTLLRLRLASIGFKTPLSRAAERHVGAEAKRLGWSWRLQRRQSKAMRAATRPSRSNPRPGSAWPVSDRSRRIGRRSGTTTATTRCGQGHVQGPPHRAQWAHIRHRSAQLRNFQPRFCQFHPDRVSQTRHVAAIAM